MARPSTPSQHAEQIARNLRGADLSGGASTIGSDGDAVSRLTTEEANKARAILGGMGVGSPTPGSAPSLLQAYAKWQQRQREAAETVAKARHERTPAETERRALKKSRKRLRRHLSEGMSAPAACAAAHRHYKRKGGRSTYITWARKVSG